MGAKWRPIAAAPEKRLVTPMGNDVVNDRGCCYLALCLAHHAERMLTQELLSGLLPLVAVAALGAGHALGAPASRGHGGHAPGVQHLELGLEGCQSCRFGCHGWAFQSISMLLRPRRHTPQSLAAAASALHLGLRGG